MFKVVIVDIPEGEEINIESHLEKEKDKDLILVNFRKVIKLNYGLEENLKKLAANLKLILAIGPFFDSNKNSLFSLLSTPSGVMARQYQLFYTRKQKEEGFTAGNELVIEEIEWGKLGMIVGNDCWLPEVGRFLALQGVDLVLVHTWMEGCNYYKQLAGIWSQVQQNQFFALEANREGLNLIHAPCEITPFQTGILAPRGNYEDIKFCKPDMYLQKIARSINYKVKAKIDKEELDKIRREYPVLKHLNPVLYQKSGVDFLAFPSGEDLT